MITGLPFTATRTKEKKTEKYLQDSNNQSTKTTPSAEEESATAKRKKGVADTVLNIVTVVCIAALLSCTVTYFMNGKDFSKMSIFGYRFVLVMSESMEPTIMTHALCIIRITDDVDVGDVIVYEYEYDDGTNVNIIHRIIEASGNSYTTKGDNNESADSDPVAQEQVVGKVVWFTNLTADILP